MKKEILSRSENMSREYCCSVVRVGEVIPVEGSDFLGKTIVDGFQIVVRKDMVKEGDIMFYATNETELNEKFLSVNNEFEDYKLNSNYESEVLPRLMTIDDCKKWINSYDTSVYDPIKDTQLVVKHEQIRLLEEELRALRGFFNKYGRVKMITLRKCPSFGYLFTVDAMAKYCPEIKNIDLDAFIDNPNSDRDFDTVNGELFVKAYMPRVKKNENNTNGSRNERKRQKNVDKISRIVENQFVFHYDTQPLNKNMFKITPDEKLFISCKVHGTSAIFSNIKVKSPREYHGIFGKILTYINNKVIPSKFRKYDIVYDNIYSSRAVIKNQYLNENVTSGFYGTDIWGEYNELLKGLIPEGMTLYGEIVGYLTDSSSMIQKGYDYGCKVGENKLMIYRITTEEDGTKKEWEIPDVIVWSENLRKSNESLLNKILPFQLLYYGTLSERYPNIPIDNCWNESVLEALKVDSEFHMEENEPMCNNKVPREGIVLRIENDPVKEAFKLKCSKFLQMEGKLIDSGEVDMEMDMRYQL